MLDDLMSTECESLMDIPNLRTIVSLIREGENNAVHGADLARYVNMDARELRQAIERLRRNGVIIASSQKGYYYPANMGELAAFVHKEERRARSVFYTIKTARQLLKQQEALDGKRKEKQS